MMDIRIPSMSLLAAWMIVLLYYSIIPTIPGTGGAGNLHLPAYFVLAVLLFSVLHTKHDFRRSVFAAIMLSTYYGLLLEGIQFFAPGRVMAAEDILINLAGSCFALLFVPVLARRPIQINKTIENKE